MVPETAHQGAAPARGLESREGGAPPAPSLIDAAGISCAAGPQEAGLCRQHGREGGLSPPPHPPAQSQRDLGLRGWCPPPGSQAWGQLCGRGASFLLSLPQPWTATQPLTPPGSGEEWEACPILGWATGGPRNDRSRSRAEIKAGGWQKWPLGTCWQPCPGGQGWHDGGHWEGPWHGAQRPGFEPSLLRVPPRSGTPLTLRLLVYTMGPAQPPPCAPWQDTRGGAGSQRRWGHPGSVRGVPS